MDKLSVSEAAARLGVTPDAVRQRIRRDTIEWERTEEGRYYVYLSPDDTKPDTVQDALVDRLKDENEWLRREVERKDTIIMSLTQRIPELEPSVASEPRESPVSASEEPYNTHAPPVPDTQVSVAQNKRSWWRAFFGLE